MMGMPVFRPAIAMDPGRVTLRLSFLFLFVLFCCCAVARGNGVFQVRRRLVAPEDFRAHDRHRHGRFLGAVDLPLGGRGLPSDAGLYFAQIGIGSPSKNYYVQVDTGSDILWVNCIQCKRCSSHSDLGVELTLYDLKSSHSGRLVTCDQEFCAATYGGELEGCKPELPCPYSVTYGDGSGTNGYYVTDFLQYDQVTGNHQTSQVNVSVTFGCGAQQSGDLGSSNGALDGILGFGQSNSSVISQLASSGKMRKVFAHCLDSVNGGGIFAIGHIVQPKVNTTPLVPNQPHYNVIMKGIEVGGEFLRLPSDIFDPGERKGTIIDSGTTLAYLPEAAYRPLMDAIMSHQPNLNIHRIQDFLCFEYTGSVDDGFPVVTLHFGNSLSMKVYPHDYLFQSRGEVWCIGWQNSGVQSRDGKDMILLGDLVLSNKLVLYDLEKQTIGWTEYNCSSSIKVQDDVTGQIYIVSAHNISSACRLGMERFILFFILFSISQMLIHSN